MGKMQLYDNKEIEWKECPGCEFANHSFNISCGIAYENDTFALSQDWELPIPGFMILSLKNILFHYRSLVMKKEMKCSLL